MFKISVRYLPWLDKGKKALRKFMFVGAFKTFSTQIIFESPILFKT